MTPAHRPRLTFIGIAILTAFFGAHPLAAQTHTWDGTDGDWYDASKWTPGVPGAGSAVLIPGGDVTLTNTPAELGSFTLNGGSLSFSNWTTRLVSTSIVINAGMVTHAANLVMATNSLGQWIPVARVNLECETLVVESGASINANGKGYLGGVNPGTLLGQGPGAGGRGTRGAGGGHGGRGGVGNYLVDELAPGGIPYDSASAPDQPGSGGSSGATSGEKGGPGGGAILVLASGCVTNNGVVSANGLSYQAGTRSGGGSGGSIFVTCQTIAGTGDFLVTGGNGYNGGVDNGGGAGGGGRIAIQYNPGAQSNVPMPQLGFQAGPGTEATTAAYVPPAEIGTLYFPDSQFLDALAVVGPANFKGQIILGEALAWSTPSLTVSNTWIRFPASGFELAVQNDLTIDGVNGRLDIGSTTVRSTDLRRVLFNDQPARSSLDVGGHFYLKKGSLWVYACATNSTVPDHGARVSITGDLVMSAGTLIRPISNPENGGSALFQARHVTVGPNSQINADFAGFFCDRGPGKGVKNIRAGGAGYGGTGGGGDYVYSWGGNPYGEADDPRHPGSGGGSWGVSEYGGRGGGLIRLEASGHVLCNGTLTASGERGMLNASGSGSGGGIQILCNTFAATNGLIRANGLLAGTLAGGGGGGRIALRYDPAAQVLMPRPEVTLSAAGGTGLDRGDIGTLHIPDFMLLASPITNVTGQVTGLPGWTLDSLTLSNCWIRFPEDGFALTVSNGLTLIGAAARLDIGATATLPVTVPSNHYHLYNRGVVRPTVSVGGDLLLTNGADLFVYSVATNDTTLDHGALVTVGGRMALFAQSWVSPVSNPTNGGSALFQVGSLSVAANAGFQADRAGFYSQRGPGRGVTASSRCGGGGFGGAGGNGSGAGSLGGPAYGSSNPPVDCGSGGATYNTSSGTTADYGGRGGGLIRIVAGQGIKLDGTLTANGESIPSTQTSAGGAGGGISIRARRFTGSGAVAANGGGARVAYAGGGGGGRIAIFRSGGDDFTGTYSVNGGAGYDAGEPGTIVLVTRNTGTLIKLL